MTTLPTPRPQGGGFFGVAALVLGSLGLVVSLVPFLGAYAAPLTVLAVIFGAIGLRKRPRGLAIAGFVCGLVGSCIVGCWFLIFRVATNSLETSKAQLAKVQVDKIARDYYPRYAIANADNPCPQTLLVIGKYIDPNMRSDELVDPWGSELEFACGDKFPAGARDGIAVWSIGEDHRVGTSDDIRSWQDLRK